MRHYTQLTEHQRYQIYALMKAGHDQPETAAMIGVKIRKIRVRS